MADKIELSITPMVDDAAGDSMGGGWTTDNTSWSVFEHVPRPLHTRVDRVASVNGLWWLFFPSPLPYPPPSATAPPVLLSLTHPDMLSSTTQCDKSRTITGDPVSNVTRNFTDTLISNMTRTTATSGWCRRVAEVGLSPPSPFLRYSVCARRYRPVEFSWCSNAIHTTKVMPHIRSFISYHAYLGVHRFRDIRPGRLSFSAATIY